MVSITQISHIGNCYKLFHVETMSSICPCANIFQCTYNRHGTTSTQCISITHVCRLLHMSTMDHRNNIAHSRTIAHIYAGHMRYQNIWRVLIQDMLHALESCTMTLDRPMMASGGVVEPDTTYATEYPRRGTVNRSTGRSHQDGWE